MHSEQTDRETSILLYIYTSGSTRCKEIAVVVFHSQQYSSRHVENSLAVFTHRASGNSRTLFSRRALVSPLLRVFPRHVSDVLHSSFPVVHNISFTGLSLLCIKYLSQAYSHLLLFLL
jgi:acyl-CoA synthetase (AMP-forming)/AMP-acid ligase II